MHVWNILIHFTKTKRTLKLIYHNFSNNIYLPGCISIMEDLRVVVWCVDAIQSEEKAGNDHNPTPHDKSVNKCCATVCIHHKQGNEWNQVLVPQCRPQLAFKCQIQPETIPFGGGGKESVKSLVTKFTSHLIFILPKIFPHLVGCLTTSLPIYFCHSHIWN